MVSFLSRKNNLSKDHTSEIGIDLDRKTEIDTTWLSFVNRVRKEICQLDTFKAWIKDHETKHGHHLRFSITKRITFWNSCYLRFKLHDDHTRLLMDLLRHHAGAKTFDVLFDKKDPVKIKMVLQH